MPRQAPIEASIFIRQIIFVFVGFILVGILLSGSFSFAKLIILVSIGWVIYMTFRQEKRRRNE